MLVLTIGTGLGQLIVLLSTPILTRLYSPSEFGDFALFSSVVFGIVPAIASLSYKLAVPLPKDDRDGASLIALCVAIATIISVIAAMVAWFFEVSGAAPDSVKVLTNYGWLVGIGIWVGAVYEALTYWAIRKNAIKDVARTRIGQGVAQATSQVGFGMLGVGAVGLIGGMAIGQGAGIRHLGTAAWRGAASAFRSVSYSSMVTVARRYRHFAFFSTPAAIINAITLYGPSALFVFVAGTGPGGQFALAARLVSAPTALIGQTIGKVYLADAAELARTDLAELRSRFMRLVFLLTVGAVCFGVVIAVCSPFVFNAVFGNNWQPAGQYAQILSLVLLSDFVSVPVSQTLVVLERQGLTLWADVIEFVAVGSLFALVMLLGLSPVWLVAAYAVGNFVGGVTLLLFSRSALTRSTQPLAGPRVAPEG